MAASDDRYLTVKEASELLGVAPNTLRSWSAAGKIDEYRHPVNNYRLFRQADVEKLVLKISNPEPQRTKKQPSRRQ